MSVVGLTIMGWVAGAIAVTLITIALIYWARAAEMLKTLAADETETEEPSQKVTRPSLVNRSIMTALIVGAIIATLVTVITIILYFNTTAVGEAKLKAWRAQSTGIERTVEVYSMTGEKIAEYSGTFNIEYDSERVEIYDTEKATRTIVYYKNGTIIVTEPYASE